MSEFLAKSASKDMNPAVQLFAGSREISTNRGPIADELTFEQYEVISIVDGEIVKFDPAGTDGSEVAHGIILNAVDTTTATGTTGQSTAYYTGGDFNHEALVWPAAITTLADRKAAFARTSIAISSVL